MLEFAEAYLYVSEHGSLSPARRRLERIEDGTVKR
jgi:hypothetical protein